ERELRVHARGDLSGEDLHARQGEGEPEVRRRQHEATQLSGVFERAHRGDQPPEAMTEEKHGRPLARRLAGLPARPSSRGEVVHDAPELARVVEELVEPQTEPARPERPAMAAKID